MSKERELIQQMKDSMAASESASQAAGEAANQAGGAAVPAADAAGGVDLVSFFEFFNNVGGSMVSDPIFYVKALGVLILTVMIIMIAFELIAGS